MQAATPPYCPYCGQIDQVRKVSAIVDAETGWTTGPNGSSVSTQTWLASRLQPPVPPSRRGCLTGCLGLVLVPLAMLTGGCALLGLLLASLGTGLPLGALAHLLTVPVILVLVGGLSWLLAWRWERRRQLAQVQVYLAALSSWEERYYCARCDDTFIPMPAIAYTGQTIRWTT